MIGKLTIGRSFAGVVRYVMQKPEARLLHADGVRESSIQSVIDDFNTQRKINPELSRAVGHVALSWSKNDIEKLSREIMIQRAQEYMQKMKISETQYLIVEHRDRNHPHLHIIYNRVDNKGKTISDRLQKVRNQKVCKEMTLKHGYYLGKDKSLVNRHRLTGADKVKYELYDAITKASQKAKNWNELAALLKERDIGIVFKYKSGSQQIQGISFSKGGIKMKGSEIDRGLSFAKLDEKIRQNQNQLINQHSQPTLREYSPGRTSPSLFIDSRPPISNDSLLNDLLKPEQISEEQTPYELRKKKHQKRKGHSL
ncbi:relaxase/mobilization nuclease domain-containing protein [Dyadobacter subterraneus]|uniref:Relaxase/mobilization nuclease domain-containing protein n=1 Tax=Dyadobacter subterraneus TaxID=2773304 RepID=A0ABR9W553_9BACT|nr:relaxase/mobilization nuclease domain-containing protein [Dyadobacter subterraneus]MBE9460587.1 relaxase/mobilization nuclease domain-containing protein [Dyadobacter subterraneus]